MSGILQLFPFSGGAVQNYWIATLGGSSLDQGRGITTDSSGNVYVVGGESSQGQGLSDALLTKYDTDGNIQWQYILGGTSNDYFYGIKVDSSGNIYVGGYSNQGATSNDVLIAKYNSSGTLQWQRILAGLAANSDTGQSLAIDSSSNVYISGYYNNNQQLIAKYDSTGAIQWQRLFQANSNGYGISIDTSNNIYVCGYSDVGSAGSNDAFIAKYNTSGTVQWQRILGGTLTDQALSITTDGSGNVYISGQTNSQGAGSVDALIAKYDSTGAIQWQRILGGASAEFGRAIVSDSSGNVYFTGSTTSGTSPSDVIIAKYNTSGTIQWQRYLDGGYDEIAYGITLDNKNNFYITGYSISQSHSNQDVLIAKLPTDGSKTGTYGIWTYAASSFTAATSTLTSATSTATETAGLLVDSAGSLTTGTSTLTSTVTSVI